MEEPPKLLQALLSLVLNREELEPIAGDLMEEYVLTKQAQLGHWGASLWYMEQIMSLIFSRLFEGRWPTKSIALLSVFNLVAGCWLVAMEQILGHPGNDVRTAVDLGIVAESLIVLAWLVRRDRGWLMSAAALSVMGTVVLSVTTLRSVASSGHFEGFAFVIATTLCLQGLLTLFVLMTKSRKLTN